MGGETKCNTSHIFSAGWHEATSPVTFSSNHVFTHLKKFRYIGRFREPVRNVAPCRISGNLFAFDKQSVIIDGRNMHHEPRRFCRKIITSTK